jgi:hypothetical protein
MNKMKRPGRITIVLLLLVAGVAVYAGCNTVAEISFEIRKFDRVESGGVAASAAACQMDDSRVELRFVLLDQESKVIRPGDRLETEQVELGDTFRASDVTLDTGRIYPTSEKALIVCPAGCQTEADCAGQAGRFCVNNYCLPTQDTEQNPHESCYAYGYDVCKPHVMEQGGDVLGRSFSSNEMVSFCRSSCTDDAECGEGRCVDDGDGANYCTFNLVGDFCDSSGQCEAGFTCEPIDGDPMGRKFCARNTLVEVIPSSLEFISPLPPDGRAEAFRAIAMVMDNSGSLFGRGVVESDRTVKLDRATDPDLFRIAAAKAFLLNLENKEFSQNAVVSVWSYRGTTDVGVKALTGITDDVPVRPYVSNLQPAGPAHRALDQLSQAGDYGRSNVFIAIQTVAQNLTDNNIDPSVRHPTIIIFTDGPDDSVEWTPAAGNEQLAQQRARWDANLEASITAARSAGAEVFVIHLDTGIGPDGVSVLGPDPGNVRPYPLDANGRTGPIGEYARVACETGGQYLYVQDPRALGDVFDLMVNLLGGTWKVDLGVGALSAATTNGPYRLGAGLTINLDNRNKNASFSPLGRQTAYGLIETDDSRPVIFRREGIPADRPTPGVPGGGGNNGGNNGEANNGTD